MPPLQLYGSVGPDEENDPEDVASVRNSLMDIGLPGARDATSPGAWDNHFDATVRSFQENNGLEVDGILNPGGPTQAAINRSLQGQGAAPARSEMRFDREGLSAAGIVDEARAFAGMLDENALAGVRRASEARASGDEFGYRGIPRISNRAARAITEGSRRREAQRDEFLKLLGPPPSAPAQAAESLPPPTPASGEAERLLTAHGYRYVPDPMGRVGWGEWVDDSGKRLDQATQPDIVGGWRHDSRSEVPDSAPNDDASATHHDPHPEDGASPDNYFDALAAVLEDGAVPASDGRQLIELFAQILIAQRGYGAKTLRLPGSLHGKQTYPPELARRVDLVPNEGVRLGIQQAIKGSIPERARVPHGHDLVLGKFGTTNNMVADFYAMVRLSGGWREGIKPAKDKPGVWYYKAPDNVTFIMRRTSSDGRPTNEIQIVPPGGDRTKIKIRYTTDVSKLKP